MAFAAFPLRAFLLPASLFLVLLHQAAPGLLLILGSDGLGHGGGDSVLLRIVRSLLPLVGALGGGDRSSTFNCDFSHIPSRSQGELLVPDPGSEYEH
jgi:hypothetical protein